MRHLIKTAVLIVTMFSATAVLAQDDSQANTDDYQINTVFKPGRVAVGGYGAITNKFTSINGRFANLAGVYGGVYLNHRVMLGVSGAALTNDIRVPLEHSVQPLENLSYMYGQFGGIGEYVVASNKAFHVAFNLFAGAGFTLQYDRDDWHDDRHEFDWDYKEDQDWFFVAEPGVMVEFNIFRWMRFSPGISYRAVFNSDGRGLGNSALSDISYNATLKFGKF